MCTIIPGERTSCYLCVQLTSLRVVLSVSILRVRNYHIDIINSSSSVLLCCSCYSLQDEQRIRKNDDKQQQTRRNRKTDQTLKDRQTEEEKTGGTGTYY